MKDSPTLTAENKSSPVFPSHGRSNTSSVAMDAESKFVGRCEKQKINEEAIRNSLEKISETK
jgi:hypothetical protein